MYMYGRENLPFVYLFENTSCQVEKGSSSGISFAQCAAHLVLLRCVNKFTIYHIYAVTSSLVSTEWHWEIITTSVLS